MTTLVGPEPKDKCPCRRQRRPLRKGVGKPEAETDGDTVLRDKEVGRPLPEIFQKTDPADNLILNSRLLELAIMFSVVLKTQPFELLREELGKEVSCRPYSQTSARLPELLNFSSMFPQCSLSLSLSCSIKPNDS